MRWLRARAAGKQQVREFELVRGRAHTGKKSWIVSFDGVDNLDEVCLLCIPLESFAFCWLICVRCTSTSLSGSVVSSLA